MANRKKKALKNIGFGLLNKIIVTFFPFIIRSLFIKKIGIECLGLTNLCNSVLGVLNLADLGFGGVIVYFMYKPAEEGNTEQLCKLLNFFRKVYYVVGVIILIAGLTIMPFLPFFIHGAPPSGVNIYLVFFIFLINSVISYFLFAYKLSLLNVNQRLDIESKINSGINILTYICELIILLTINNYYLYISILPVFSILLNLIRSKIVDRLFPDIKCKGELSSTEKKELWKKILATFFFKIDSIVITMADSIVISSFLGLITLANYNNYFLILNGIAGFLIVIQSSLQPTIGNSVAAESMEKNYNDMKLFHFFWCWILCFCGSCFLNMYQPFISIWLGDQYLLPYSTVLFIVLYFYSWYSCTPLNIYKDANGFWTQDRYRPLIEAPFNLILNIILVKFIGLNGVLISTAVTLGLISLPVVYWVMNKYYFIGKWKEYTFKTIVYLLISIGINTISYYLCSFIKYDGIKKLLLNFLISSASSLVLFPIIFIKTDEFKRFISLLRAFTNKLKKAETR